MTLRKNFIGMLQKLPCKFFYITDSLQCLVHIMYFVYAKFYRELQHLD